MKQILGLLKKDILFVPRIILGNVIDVTYFTFTIVIAGRVTNLNLNVFAALCSITVALLIFSNLDNDEKCGAEKIFGALPITPRQIVVSKFLFGFIVVFSCIVLFSAANFACRMFFPDIKLIYDGALQFGGLLGASVLMFCILIPIYCSGLFRSSGNLTSITFVVIYLVGSAASLLGIQDAAGIITGGAVSSAAAQGEIKMPLFLYNSIIIASVFSLSMIFTCVSFQLSFSNYELKGYWVSVSDFKKSFSYGVASARKEPGRLDSASKGVKKE